MGERAKKRENEISQVINGREELLLLLFPTTVAVAVCAMLHLGMDRLGRESPRKKICKINSIFWKVIISGETFWTSVSLSIVH